jgi:hypothetical protein
VSPSPFSAFSIAPLLLPVTVRGSSGFVRSSENSLVSKQENHSAIVLTQVKKRHIELIVSRHGIVVEDERWTKPKIKNQFARSLSQAFRESRVLLIF